MKLSQLRALVAVADRKHFSEAALDLELSQSAVSHAIATLEAELGVPFYLGTASSLSFDRACYQYLLLRPTLQALGAVKFPLKRYLQGQ